jgi:hypothetical protein
VRKIAVVPLLALVLSVPAAAPALADGVEGARGGHSSAKSEGGRSDAGRHAKPKRIRFTEIGTVTATDQDGDTLTLTVQRGSIKALRGRALSVGITVTTVIHRDCARAELGDVLAGDRVVVEGVRTETSYIALHVRARSARTPGGDATPTPSVTPTPSPTSTPSVTPTPTATPTVTATSTPSATV